MWGYFRRRGEIDFNDLSTRLELFYAEWLGNRVHNTFIFTFFWEFLNWGIWLIDETLTDTTSLDQSSNGYKGILCIPHISRIGTSPSDVV